MPEKFASLGTGAKIPVSFLDEVKEVVTLENSAVEKFTYDSKEERNGNLIGVGKSNGQLISLLDMSIVVAEKEKE